MKLLAPLAALALCYALFAGYLVLSYSSLPDRVASHFDLMGRPNGWMSRDTLVGFSICLGLAQPLFIVGMMGIGAWKNWRDRRDLAETLLSYGTWFACLNLLFVTGVHWSVVQANGQPDAPHLSASSIFVVGVSFMAATLVWGALLIRQVRKAKSVLRS